MGYKRTSKEELPPYDNFVGRDGMLCNQLIERWIYDLAINCIVFLEDKIPKLLRSKFHVSLTIEIFPQEHLLPIYQVNQQFSFTH